MTLLENQGTHVRLECHNCGSHRVIEPWVYSWAVRSGTPVTCPTCLDSELPAGGGDPAFFAEAAPGFNRVIQSI